MKTKNQIKGEFCETKVENQLESECLDVKPLQKGADFICIKKNGDISFVEAKCNKSQLTDFQKKFKTQVGALGLKYEEIRCSCPENE